MWKDGVGIEMPSEYKKRYSAALGTPASKEDVSNSGNGGDDKGDQKSRLLSRLSAMLKQGEPSV